MEAVEILERLKGFNQVCREFHAWADGIGYKVQVYKGAQKWEDEVMVQARLVQKEVVVVEEGGRTIPPMKNIMANPMIMPCGYDATGLEALDVIHREFIGGVAAIVDKDGDNSSFDEYVEMEEAVGNVEVSGEKRIRNSEGKVIGTIVGGTLKKAVLGSKHKLRNPEAWCWDERAIAEAKQAGCMGLQIFDKESGKMYRASMLEMDTYGFRFDRGHGVQRGLKMMHWGVK